MTKTRAERALDLEAWADRVSVDELQRGGHPWAAGDR